MRGYKGWDAIGRREEGGRGNDVSISRMYPRMRTDKRERRNQKKNREREIKSHNE